MNYSTPPTSPYPIGHLDTQKSHAARRLHLSPHFPLSPLSPVPASLPQDSLSSSPPFSPSSTPYNSPSMTMEALQVGSPPGKNRPSIKSSPSLPQHSLSSSPPASPSSPQQSPLQPASPSPTQHSPSSTLHSPPSPLQPASFKTMKQRLNDEYPTEKAVLEVGSPPDKDCPSINSPPLLVKKGDQPITITHPATVGFVIISKEERGSATQRVDSETPSTAKPHQSQIDQKPLVAGSSPVIVDDSYSKRAATVRRYLGNEFNPNGYSYVSCRNSGK